jgi:hypothetical protein
MRDRYSTYACGRTGTLPWGDGLAGVRGAGTGTDGWIVATAIGADDDGLSDFRYYQPSRIDRPRTGSRGAGLSSRPLLLSVNLTAHSGVIATNFLSR